MIIFIIFVKIKNCVFLADGKSNSDCFENNIDFSFSDLLKSTRKSISSAEDCQKECRRNFRCKFFTYHKIRKDCYLKKSDSGRRQAADYISGSKNCPQSSNSRGNFYLIQLQKL